MPANYVRSRALLVVILAALALIAAPTAHAAKPTRTVVSPEGGIAPAGVICPFAVQLQPDEPWQAITEFSDGRVQTIGHGNVTLTNLDTGHSIHTKSRYKGTETFDPDANEVLIETSGRVFWGLIEGEQGPFGEVGEGGALFRFVGHFKATSDLDTELVTSLSWNGQITDLCALLAE